jgi:hypothetical protein
MPRCSYSTTGWISHEDPPGKRFEEEFAANNRSGSLKFPKGTELMPYMLLLGCRRHFNQN